jgi:aspartyl-tRNA synthetase
VLVGEDGELGGPVAKNLSEAEREGWSSTPAQPAGDCIFFAAGTRSEAYGLLAATRLEVGERCGLIDHSRWEFCWVVDAPMFERIDTADGSPAWHAIHHPFTAPTASSRATSTSGPARR